MQSKYIYIYVLITIFSQLCHGKYANKTKTSDIGQKKPYAHKSISSRFKRAIRDLDENTFISKNNKDIDSSSNQDHTNDDIHPFWGTRGKRNSFSQEYENIYRGQNKKYKQCLRSTNIGNNLKTRQYDDDEEPFWGNRGRRSSEELYTNGLRSVDPHVVNRDTLDDDDPFWGARGRRENSYSEIPEKPNIPFWSARGRRDEDSEPFWGNRGRRVDIESFSGNRNKNKEYEDNDNRNYHENMKKTLLKAIRVVEEDINKKISEGQNKNFLMNSFSGNRGPKYASGPGSFSVNPTESRTVLDNRIYAEQPHYIVVERNSRSSSELDPFYISRGKKVKNNEFMKAARDRRGSLEDLVKSVKNDPYFIARGKKYNDVPNDRLNKVKEFICATVGLVTKKNENGKVKREITDSDRDRRNTLKKLAAQLQIDPYFVSRGKKDGDFVATDDNIENFVKDIANKCNM